MATTGKSPVLRSLAKKLHYLFRKVRIVEVRAKPQVPQKLAICIVAKNVIVAREVDERIVLNRERHVVGLLRHTNIISSRHLRLDVIVTTVKVCSSG